MLRTSAYVLSCQILIYIFLIQIVFTLKFQTSNLNAGRSRLVLFQGKIRHEIMGRSCPVGVSFTSPQLFSCACVTGVWAFYDIMCAPPIQIIGGVNHCFKMPLDTYIQQAILLSNPTRAHGNSLTAFNGDMESVQNKFFRQTHSQLKTPSQLLTIGATWTLKNPIISQQVCLDSTKNKVFEEADTGPSLTSAYCTFENVSKAIPNVGSVSVGCKDNLNKVEPSHCYPFLDTNSEEICNDLELLEAYEMAVEQENNDLTRRNTTTREFKKLNKNKMKKALKTTSTTKLMDKVTTITTKTTATTLPATSQHDDKLKIMKHVEEKASTTPSDREMKKTTIRERSSIPKNKINPIIDNLLNDGNNDDDASSLRGHRRQTTDDDLVLQKDPTLHDYAAMKSIYQDTVKNQGNFLVLSGTDSDRIVLKHVWEYQQEQVKKALQLKLNSIQNVEPPPRKLQIQQVFDRAIDVMMTTCQAVPQGFLQLAMDTFINIQEKEFRWHPPFFTDKELDGIISSLERCKNESRNYNFLQGHGAEKSACARRNPQEIMIGSKRERLEISEKINSDGYEPLIEALWKVGVHAITYCQPYLHSDFRASSKLNIVITEIFRNQIHLIWFRKKMIDMEYGGVLGDTKFILKDLDLCLIAAKKLTQSIVEFVRPEFVAPPGWLPTDALNESTEKEQVEQRETRNINSISKDTQNQIPISYLMDEEKESQLILNSLPQVPQVPTVTLTPLTTPNMIITEILNTINSPINEIFNANKSSLTETTTQVPTVSLLDVTKASISATSLEQLQQQLQPPLSTNLTLELFNHTTIPLNYDHFMSTTPETSINVESGQKSNSSESESESESESNSHEEGSENPVRKSETIMTTPLETDIDIDTNSLIQNEDAKSRKKRSLRELEITKAQAQENWRKQRTILSGMGICLKKFDEAQTHLGQDCE